MDKLRFIDPINAPYFSCFGKKSAKRNRHRRGASDKCALSYVPLQPHRHPAFKNVPIFERLHIANPQVCSAESAENRNIFSGRQALRREWGPGRVVHFARNASPRTTSLVTFLFGSQESNIIRWSDKLQFEVSSAVSNRLGQKESDECGPFDPALAVGPADLKFETRWGYEYEKMHHFLCGGV